MAQVKADPVSMLRAEHKGIVRQLNFVGKAAASVHGPPTERLSRSVSRLETLVARHFAYEETAVYAPLKISLGRDNPVDGMRREHRLLLQALRRLASQSDGSSPRELQSSLLSFQESLGAHMEKEEEVLFWLADLKL